MEGAAAIARVGQVFAQFPHTHGRAIDAFITTAEPLMLLSPICSRLHEKRAIEITAIKRTFFIVLVLIKRIEVNQTLLRTPVKILPFFSTTRDAFENN